MSAALLMITPGGIPLSDRGRSSAYLTAINGQSKTYTADYRRVLDIAKIAAADLRSKGYEADHFDGAEATYQTAGPRYHRDNMFGTWVKLRFTAGEWHLVEAEKVPAWPFMKARLTTRPSAAAIPTIPDTADQTWPVWHRANRGRRQAFTPTPTP